MDPLSLSASILAVLGATTSLLSVCYGIRRGLRSAPWALIQIIEETRDLRNIVEALQSTLDGNDQVIGPSTELFGNAIRAPLAACLAEVSSLESKIQPSSLESIMKSKKSAMLHAVTWHLKDGEARESIARLDRCKNSLVLAITSKNL